MAEAREPFNVKCSKCSHVWTAAWLPMEMATCAKVLAELHCPSCGNGPENIFVHHTKAQAQS